MKIVDFRILVPLSMIEYQKGMRYVYMRKTKEEIESGQEIDFLETSVKEKDGVQYEYSHKIIHIGKKIPKIIRWALPKNIGEIHEENYRGHPRSETRLSIPGMDRKFKCDILSFCQEYTPHEQNAFSLTPKEMSHLHVCYLDLFNNEPVHQNHDPRRMKSKYYNFNQFFLSSRKEKSDSPPWWSLSYRGPLIICHKLVKVECHVDGISKTLEKHVCQDICRNLYLDNHQCLISWIDEWINLTDSKLMELERNSIKLTLQSQRRVNSHQ